MFASADPVVNWKGEWPSLISELNSRLPLLLEECSKAAGVQSVAAAEECVFKEWSDILQTFIGLELFRWTVKL